MSEIEKLHRRLDQMLSSSKELKSSVLDLCGDFSYLLKQVNFIDDQLSSSEEEIEENITQYEFLWILSPIFTFTLLIMCEKVYLWTKFSFSQYSLYK